MSEESPSNGIGIGRRSLLKGVGAATGIALLGASGVAVGQDDSSGPDIEWRRDYSGGDTEYDIELRHVAQTETGGYALAGSGAPITRTGKEEAQFAVVGADANGDQQWVAFANDDSDETTNPTPTELTQTADGAHVVVGYLDNPSERQADQRSGSHAAALKVTPDGTVSWVETINTFDGEEEGRTDESDALFRGVAPAGDDGGVVAGGTKEGQGWVVQFGPDGSIEWETTWTDQNDDESRNAFVEEVHARDDGGYLLFTSQGGVQEDRHFAVYISDTGEIQDRVELEIDYDETPYNHDFVATADGGYAYTGRDAGQENFVLVKLNSDGERVWREEYQGPGEGSDWAHFLVQTTDGGFALCGDMAEAYSLDNKPAILKTAADGTEQYEKLVDSPEGEPLDFIETADSGYAYVQSPAELVKFTPDDVPESGGTETPDDGDDDTETPSEDDGSTDTPDDGDSNTETPSDGDGGTDTPADDDSGTDVPADDETGSGDDGTDTEEDC